MCIYSVKLNIIHIKIYVYIVTLRLENWTPFQFSCNTCSLLYFEHFPMLVNFLQLFKLLLRRIVVMCLLASILPALRFIKKREESFLQFQEEYKLTQPLRRVAYQLLSKLQPTNTLSQQTCCWEWILQVYVHLKVVHSFHYSGYFKNKNLEKISVSTMGNYLSEVWCGIKSYIALKMGPSLCTNTGRTPRYIVK